VSLSGADRLKIVCDPFWSSNSRGTRLSSRKTYDVLDLLVPEAGTWTFSLSMGQNGRSLVLHQSMLTEGGRDVRPPQSTVLQMEFRRSSGCFLIEVAEDIDSLDCGLGLENDGTFVALTSELEQSLESKIKEKLAARPHLITSCRFADSPVRSPRQNKRRPADTSGGRARRRVIGNMKPRYARLPPIRAPPARRRPFRPYREPEPEPDEEMEILDPVSDSESYHSIPTSRESSVSLGAFAQS
ncbi:hypothetical protein LZ30DRAFT_793231, partial [Colletotrichum cereale]